MLRPLIIGVGPATWPEAHQEVTSFSGLSIRRNMDDGHTITFTALGTSQEALYIDEQASDVWVSGPISQRFRILTADQTWSVDGQDIITVTGVSYKKLPTWRNLYRDMAFTNIDQGEIIWRLLEYTQNQPGGNWNLTLGHYLTGMERTRVYSNGDNIAKLIKDMQGVINGPVWDIDADLVYSAWLASDYRTHPQPLHQGVNCSDLKRKGGIFINAVWGDSSNLAPATRDAANIITDPRGRWERTGNWPNVTVPDALQEHVDGLLADLMSPAATWTCEVIPDRWETDSNYQPGEYIVVVIPRTEAAGLGGPAQRATALVQLVDIKVDQSEDGALVVTLACVEVSRTYLPALPPLPPPSQQVTVTVALHNPS